MESPINGKAFLVVKFLIFLSFLSARVAKQDLVIPIWMMKSDRFEKIVIFILYSIFLSDDAKPGILLCNQIFWGKFHAQFKFFKINQNVLFERVLGCCLKGIWGGVRKGFGVVSY